MGFRDIARRAARPARGHAEGAQGSACSDEGEPSPLTWWQVRLAAIPVMLVLVLGFANLGVPSLWHDEAVHVLVAKSILETGEARLPSGEPYQNANFYNAIMAGFIALWGDGEVAVRAPAVLFGALSVVLTYALARQLLGHSVALVAALFLAISPWQIAWSREARFYTCQQALYLLTLWGIWRGSRSVTPSRMGGYFALALGAYVLGVLASLHSVIFLTPIAVYAALMGLRERPNRWRWFWLAAGTVLAMGATVIAFKLILSPLDNRAVFEHSGLGGRQSSGSLPDHIFSARNFYTDWLGRNLSTGFYYCVVLGSVLMAFKERRRGLFAALAFWVPLFVLSFLISYRRPRFAFFAFPFYMMGFAYCITALARYIGRPRRTQRYAVMAVLIGLVGIRLCVSTWGLTASTLATAGGSHVTLATRHPQWREPCQYVRQNLDEDTVVVTTTFVTTLHYVGRVDEWFPSRVLWWEERESGLRGLEDAAALREYMEQHPKGYLVAEARRLEASAFVSEDAAWVREHMTRHDEGSSENVTVFSWGL